MSGQTSVFIPAASNTPARRAPPAREACFSRPEADDAVRRVDYAFFGSDRVDINGQPIKNPVVRKAHLQGVFGRDTVQKRQDQRVFPNRVLDILHRLVKLVILHGDE
jgi:hypothetical protein